MIRIYDLKFSIFSLVDILGLCLCGFILKKYINKFPNKLTPIVVVSLSLVTSFFYLSYHFGGFPIHFYLITGLENGLASIGLHQIYKQTSRYLKIKRVFKNFKKDERKIIS